MRSDLQIRHLDPADIELISEIDRSEHVVTEYVVADGELTTRSVNWDVPTFDPVGTGDHSVHSLIQTWQPVVDAGASLLGAYRGKRFLGLAIVDVSFDPSMAWLGLLHVSRTYRRRGVASALWDESVRLAIEAGARSMYVSATPSDSSVGFYLSKGCELAEQPHPDLYAREPEDIHLICQIEPPEADTDPG